MATRWGILCSGNISRDFASALTSQDHDHEEHEITAVAARSLEKAQTFADRFGIQRVYGSYEELVANSDIEVVYIGAIHSEHHRLSVLCLNAGKSVVCEKPVTMTLAAAQEVFALAKEKKLFFMEAYWSRFFPVYEKVRKEMASGALGEIVNAHASFCQNIINVSRFGDKVLTGGALIEQGAIPVMLADLIFKERPVKIQASGQFANNGMDVGGAILLTFSGGRVASIVYSLTTDSPNNCFVVNGTKGSIKVEAPFWCPTHLTTSSGEFEFPLPQCEGKMNYQNSEGLMYGQNYVRQCLQEGLREGPEMSVASSENIHYVLESVAKQLGIKYG